MYHRYKYLGIVKHSGLVGAKPPPEASEVLPHTVCGDTGFLGPVPKNLKIKVLVQFIRGLWSPSFPCC